MTFAAWLEGAERARRWIMALLGAAFLILLFSLGVWAGASFSGTISNWVFWGGIVAMNVAIGIVVLINRAQHNLYMFEMTALEAGISAKNEQLSALLNTVADWERMKRAQGSAVQ